MMGSRWPQLVFLLLAAAAPGALCRRSGPVGLDAVPTDKSSVGTGDSLSSLHDVHEVTHLPGLHSPLASQHWSGYIAVSQQRRLFFWLVEAEKHVARAPLVLWLTGGPGCSGMDALIYEHGPFKFQFEDEAMSRRSTLSVADKAILKTLGADSSSTGAGDANANDSSSDDSSTDDAGGILLTYNPYSWSQEASIIYIDSPAGTGFSYSMDTLDYRTNDNNTAEDLYVFMSEFLKVFPEYKDTDVYIAGESYGGVYVPMLANLILHKNDEAAAAAAAAQPAAAVEDAAKPGRPIIHLKGYLVGNPVTDDMYDGNAQVPFAWGHALISPSQHRHLAAACNHSYWNATQGSVCAELLADMADQLYSLNPYDILDPCVFRKDHSRTPQSRLWPFSGVRPEPGQRILNWGQANGGGSGRLGHVVPCADREISLIWLNRPATRAALHVASREITGDWTPCSDVIEYSHSGPISVIAHHKYALERGLRVLVYSGDLDFVVPYTGTLEWVYSLGLTEEDAYGPWTLDHQVMGFRARFKEGLTFATVKGAGHMVPQTSPERALELFSRFLWGEL